MLHYIFACFLFVLLLSPAHMHARKTQSSSRQSSNGNTTNFRIGPSYGRYFYRMAAPEIYMYRVNNGFASGNYRVLEVTDKFGSLQDFNGFTMVFESVQEDGFTFELGFSMRRKATDARFTYDTGPGTDVIDQYEKVKMSSNAAFLSLGYRPLAAPKLLMGFGMDFGFLRTRRKIENNTDPNSGEWGAWFYTFKIFDSGKVSSKTPIASCTFLLSYDVSVFTLRLSHSIPVLDGNMLSQTGKYTNIPWSGKVLPMRHTMFSLLYNFNHKR